MKLRFQRSERRSSLTSTGRSITSTGKKPAVIHHWTIMTILMARRIPIHAYPAMLLSSGMASVPKARRWLPILRASTQGSISGMRWTETFTFFFMGKYMDFPFCTDDFLNTEKLCAKKSITLCTLMVKYRTRFIINIMKFNRLRA
jgi:hypothetical protein